MLKETAYDNILLKLIAVKFVLMNSSRNDSLLIQLQIRQLSNDGLQQQRTSGHHYHDYSILNLLPFNVSSNKR